MCPQITRGESRFPFTINPSRLADLAKVEALLINDPAIGKEKVENEKYFREIFGKP